MGDSKGIDYLRALALSSMPALAKKPQKQNSTLVNVVRTESLGPTPARLDDKEEGELSSDDEVERSATRLLALESSLPYAHRNAGLRSNAPLQRNMRKDAHTSASTPVESVLHVGVSPASISSSAARVSIVNKPQLLSAFSAQAPSLLSSPTPKQVPGSSGDSGVSQLNTPQSDLSLTRSNLVVTNNDSVSQSSVFGTFSALHVPSSKQLTSSTTLGPFPSSRKSDREGSALKTEAYSAARHLPLADSVVPVAALESTSAVRQKSASSALDFDGSDLSSSTTFSLPVVPGSISPAVNAIGENGVGGVRKQADAFLASLRIPVSNAVASEDAFVIKFDEDSDSDGDNESLSITAAEHLDRDAQKGAKGSSGTLSASTGFQTNAVLPNPGSSDLNAEINRMKKQIAAMERTQGKNPVVQIPVKPSKVSGAEVPRHLVQLPSEVKVGVHLATTSVRPVSDDLESMRLRIAVKESELQQRRQKLAVKGPDGSKGVTGQKGTGVTPASSAPLSLPAIQVSENAFLQVKDQVGKVLSDKGPGLKKETHRRVDGIPALALAGPGGANLVGFRKSPERKGSEAGVDGNVTSNLSFSHSGPSGTFSSVQRRWPTAKTVKRSRSEEEFDEPAKIRRFEGPLLREKVDISERSTETPIHSKENPSFKHGSSLLPEASGQLKRKVNCAEESGTAVDVSSLANPQTVKKYKMSHGVGLDSDRIARGESLSGPLHHNWNGQLAPKVPSISHVLQVAPIPAGNNGNEAIPAGNLKSQAKDTPDETKDAARHELRGLSISLPPACLGVSDNNKQLATVQNTSRDSLSSLRGTQDLSVGNHLASLQLQQAECPLNTLQGPSSAPTDPVLSTSLTTSLEGQQDARPAHCSAMTIAGWEPKMLNTQKLNGNLALGKSAVRTTVSTVHVPLIPPGNSDHGVENSFRVGHSSAHNLPEKYTVQELLEEEDLLDRQLENLQEVRLSCERRERLARREYRDSQAALRAVYADCDALTRKKELLLSQLHAAEAREWAMKTSPYPSLPSSRVTSVGQRGTFEEHSPAPVDTSHGIPIGHLPGRFAAVNLNDGLDHPPRLIQGVSSRHSPTGMELAVVTSDSEQPGPVMRGGERYRLGILKMTALENDLTIDRGERDRRIHNDKAAAPGAEEAVVQPRLAQVQSQDAFEDGVLLGGGSRAGMVELRNATESSRLSHSDVVGLNISTVNSQGLSVAISSESGLPIKAAIVLDSTLLEKTVSEVEPANRSTELHPTGNVGGDDVITESFLTVFPKGKDPENPSETSFAWTAGQAKNAEFDKEGGARGAFTTSQDERGIERVHFAVKDVSGAQISRSTDVSEAVITQDEGLPQTDTMLYPLSKKLSSLPSGLMGAGAPSSTVRHEEGKVCPGPVATDLSTPACGNNSGTTVSQGETSSPPGVFVRNKASAEFKLLQKEKRSTKDILPVRGDDAKLFGIPKSISINDGIKWITTGPSCERRTDERTDQDREHLIDYFNDNTGAPAKSSQDSRPLSIAGPDSRGPSGEVKVATTSQPVLLVGKCHDADALQELTAAEVLLRLEGREVPSLKESNQKGHPPRRRYSSGGTNENATLSVELRNNEEMGNGQQTTAVLVVQDFALGNTGSNILLEQKPSVRDGDLQVFVEDGILKSDSREVSAADSIEFVRRSHSERNLGKAEEVSHHGSPHFVNEPIHSRTEDGNLVAVGSAVHSKPNGVEGDELAKAKGSELETLPKKQRSDVSKDSKQFVFKLQAPAFESKPLERESRRCESVDGEVAHDSREGLNTEITRGEGLIGSDNASLAEVDNQDHGLNVDVDAGYQEMDQMVQMDRSKLAERHYQDSERKENSGTQAEMFHSVSVDNGTNEKSFFADEAADTASSRKRDTNERSGKILPQPQHFKVEHVWDVVGKGGSDLLHGRDLHAEESLQGENGNSLLVVRENLKPDAPIADGPDIGRSSSVQTPSLNKGGAILFPATYADEQAVEHWVPSAGSLVVLSCIPRTDACIPAKPVSVSNPEKPNVDSVPKASGATLSLKYESPLSIFRSSRIHPHFSEKLYPKRDSNTWSHTISPFKLLCKFEHRGKCNNEDCPWQHAEDYTVSSEQLESQMQNYTAGDTVISNDGTVPADSRTGNNLSFATVATPIRQQSITAVARTVMSSRSKTRQNPASPLLKISQVSVPLYRNGLDRLKAQDPTEKCFLSYSLQLGRKYDNFRSFLLSLSIHRPLPPDIPCLLDTLEMFSPLSERTPVHQVKSPNRRYTQESQDKLVRTKVGSTEQGSIDEQAWLELALRQIKYDSCTLNDKERDQALYYLSRALESRPSSTPLWVVYASLFHMRKNNLEEDDMFQHAVSFNKGSYPLWILYINSRPDFEMRLEAYETAILALSDDGQGIPAAAKEELSACILDVGLQMLYCWCVAGRLENAFTWVENLIFEASTEELRNSAVGCPAALLSCLTQHDACILWMACTYLLACSQLPAKFVARLGCRQELPEDLSWEEHAKLDETTSKHVIGTLRIAASQGLGCLALESTRGHGDHFAKEVFGTNYVQCLALYEGLESAASFGQKLMALYPTSVDLVITCARITERQKGPSMGLHVFEEALLRWPRHDLSGIQYFWNQYAGHALLWAGKDVAKIVIQRCISFTGKDSGKGSDVSPTLAKFSRSTVSGGSEDNPIDQFGEDWGSVAEYFVALSASNESALPEDSVFALVNLAFVLALGREFSGSQAAINRALKEAASQKLLKHCWRELAASHVLHGSNSASRTGLCTLDENLLFLLDRYVKESHIVSQLKPLFQKSFEGIKKLRMRKFFEDLVGPTPFDYSLLNSLLQTIYGPNLLPDECSFKNLCHLGEGILEAIPGNVPLAISLCRMVLQLSEAPKRLHMSAAVWACALLTSTLFQSYPVAPEAYWVETGLILRRVAERKSLEEFYAKALLTYPYSLALQQGLNGVLDELQVSDSPSHTPEQRHSDGGKTEPFDATVKG